MDADRYIKRIDMEHLFDVVVEFTSSPFSRFSFERDPSTDQFYMIAFSKNEDRDERDENDAATIREHSAILAHHESDRDGKRKVFEDMVVDMGTVPKSVVTTVDKLGGDNELRGSHSLPLCRSPPLTKTGLNARVGNAYDNLLDTHGKSYREKLMKALKGFLDDDFLQVVRHIESLLSSDAPRKTEAMRVVYDTVESAWEKLYPTDDDKLGCYARIGKALMSRPETARR